MTEKQKAADQIFSAGFNCAQSILAAFADELNLDRETALKLSSGFGGGMRQGELCGAVTGSVMALGLVRGHTKANDPESKEKAYELTNEFTSRFKEKFGTLICRDLLGYDLTRDEDLAVLKEKDIFAKECPRFIAGAASILEDMLGKY